jgi:hypothetical protein
MLAYRVEVETEGLSCNTTTTLDGRLVDCRGGAVIVVTNDPAMIMRTFRVVRLERIGPGYALVDHQEGDHEAT